jgi:AAA-like domain/TIR domain
MSVLPSAPLNVFISYSHKDDDLREELVVHLANLQHQGKILAWTDRGIEAGTEWDAEIKHQLETASVILLLISPPFMASKYCYDLEMQRAVQRHHEGTTRVIPIILRPVDWKDSPFSKLQVLPKDAKPVTQWGDRDSAFLNVVEGIRGAVESLQAAQVKPKGATAEEKPLPLTILPVPLELEEPSGQVPLDSSFYIDRPPTETRCYEAILKPGALIRIKAPRQVGKSSLMIRILNEARRKGYQATWLSLQRADASALDNLDGFLRWLCTCVSRNLRLPNQVAEFWEKEATLGSNDKCTYYFEEHLLEKLSVPLALCLDEVDELFKYEQIARDFLGLLRAWHEEAKVNPLWQNLRLIITHSKEGYIPLKSNQSPFNVGLPINPLLSLSPE